jgi:hypothetical protein
VPLGTTVQKGRPQITVVTVAGSEVTHTFTVHCRAFQVNCHSFDDIRFAWVSGETADTKKYFVLRGGATWWEDDVYFGGTSVVLYMKRDTGSTNTTVAIQEWF